MIYKVVNEFYKSVMAKGIYSLIYNPGEIVVAPPGTLGIMAFEQMRLAIKFAEMCSGSSVCKILSAEPIGPITKPKMVCIFTGETNLNYYYGKQVLEDFDVPSREETDIPSPHGTICCQSIKVSQKMNVALMIRI